MSAPAGARSANMAGAVILPFEGRWPRIHPSAFVAPGAVIIGDVGIAEEASIWFGCVLRGDVNEIRIGPRSNLQDGTVVHVATHGQGCYVGADVTVGHMAWLHACTVADWGFIGMKACVMDGARVEKRAMVAAGALVTPGKLVPSGELWAGAPARCQRPLGDREQALIDWSAPHYVTLMRRYRDAEPGPRPD